MKNLLKYLNKTTSPHSMKGRILKYIGITITTISIGLMSYTLSHKPTSDNEIYQKFTYINQEITNSLQEQDITKTQLRDHIDYLLMDRPYVNDPEVISGQTEIEDAKQNKTNKALIYGGLSLIGMYFWGRGRIKQQGQFQTSKSETNGK